MIIQRTYFSWWVIIIATFVLIFFNYYIAVPMTVAVTAIASLIGITVDTFKTIYYQGKYDMITNGNTFRKEKMNNAGIYLFFVLIFAHVSGCTGIVQKTVNQPEFIVEVPSSIDEAKYIWNLIKKIQFFQNHGYNLLLPDDEIIPNLIHKSKLNKLSTADWNRFKKIFAERIFVDSDYSSGYEIVKSSLYSANKAIMRFEVYQKKWGFYIPRKYRVVLTLYGPGGSYDHKSGRIILMTTKDGTFKRGKNPLETLLHEAVHIGIEDTVVKKYKLSHWMKERIVDIFMVHHFTDICPDYKIQPNTDRSIDVILNDPSVWENLPNEVDRFLSNNKILMKLGTNGQKLDSTTM